jgi:2-C-methyl-D-erythritol 4-phosphate cytidylyltransferase
MPDTQDDEARGLPTLGVAIPAAGSGRRMGGARKPLLDLSGHPILWHALRPFLDHPSVTSVAVALSEEDLLAPPPWLEGMDRRIVLVRGGDSRGDSVWAAIQALPGSVDLIAVHDAARPLVTRSIIDRCIQATGTNSGAVAGWPAVDTLKKVGEGNRILGTLPRDEVWHAHTPQVFPGGLLREAYEAAQRDGISDTDDAALVERVGGEVVMVPGSPSNLKVTQPQDLALARHFLREEEG